MILISVGCYFSGAFHLLVLFHIFDRRRWRWSLFRIVHAWSAIPNEVGPTRCRTATPALTVS